MCSRLTVTSIQLGKCPVALDDLREMVRMINLATAVYGLTVFTVTKGLHGTVRHKVASDQKAFLALAGLESANVLFGKFESALCQPAFAVVVLPIERLVVLVIRGTLEVDDIITDIIGDSAELKVKVKAEETVMPLLEGEDAKHLDESESEPVVERVLGLGHSGMLKSAEWLRQYENALPLALRKLKELRSESESESQLDPGRAWNLRITGHSAGGGIASLLSVLICNQPEYDWCTKQGFHCYAFAPPPVLDLKLGRSSSFVTTITRGYDFAPTMSMHNVFGLREWMVTPRSDKLKSRSTFGFRSLIGLGPGKSVREKEGRGIEDGSGSGAKTEDVVIDIGAEQIGASDSSSVSSSAAPTPTPINPARRRHQYATDNSSRLYLAGTVYHIPNKVKITEPRAGAFFRLFGCACARACCGRTRSIESIFEIDPASFHQRVRLHRWMFWHHLPWLYESALIRLLAQCDTAGD